MSTATEKPEAVIKHRAHSAGEIRSDSVYGLDLFCQLIGFDRAAMRAAEKRGLRVIKCGRRKYIVGSHWREFLESLQ
jgi:hypothetical protein